MPLRLTAKRNPNGEPDPVGPGPVPAGAVRNAGVR